MTLWDTIIFLGVDSTTDPSLPTASSIMLLVNRSLVSPTPAGNSSSQASSRSPRQRGLIEKISPF
ncbi:hypothetical protein [Microseira wollei]|uniref:hypothetical protein n=1 Tax=Microseira wollei TaxID=467598 RepID=UPI001CFE874C|nr:hypothetical protein [Microseira wollei]